MFHLKNRQSNTIEMAIELLQNSLKLNQMSVITNKLNDFLKANDGKLEVSIKNLYQLFSEVELMEKGSDNIKKGAAIIFGGNVSNSYENDSCTRKLVESALEKDTIYPPSYKKDIEISNSIEKLLEGLSARKAKEILQTTLDCIDDSSIVKSRT